METIAGIKRVLESMKRNGGKPVEKFFREFSLRKAFQSASEAVHPLLDRTRV
jgi:hypothetical protein